MLAYDFAQRALIGGVLVAVACSLISFFVVVRRLAFVGMGISHAAFGGVAIGLAAGIDPVISAGGFCAAVALGIGWFSRKGRIHEDTVIGILFATSMALGVLLVRLAGSYNLDLMSYLFGSILALSWNDVAIIAIVGVIAAAFILLFFKELLFISFDEETATASGLPVRFAYYGLLVTMALTIVISIKLVGIILVSALLVIPAAAGVQLSRNYRWVLLIAVLVGTASVVLGLYLSFWYDVASGATIVLVLFASFLLSMAFSPRRRYMQRLRRRGDRDATERRGHDLGLGGSGPHPGGHRGRKDLEEGKTYIYDKEGFAELGFQSPAAIVTSKAVSPDSGAEAGNVFVKPMDGKVAAIESIRKYIVRSTGGE